jgi:hypothetical protein
MKMEHFLTSGVPKTLGSAKAGGFVFLALKGSLANLGSVVKSQFNYKAN